jgi:ligand-binding SRPBCC domain-containing protein
VDFHFEQVIAARREAVFAWHEDPGRLAALSEGMPGFRMVGHDGNIRPGALTRVEVRVGPFPVRMHHRHFLHEPPRGFGDRQVRGPFAVFEHLHSFEEAEGGTILRDDLRVRLPFWMGGELATRLFVAPRLRGYFALRAAAYARLAAAGAFGPDTAR